jgi:hypothetical protein
LIDRRRFVQVLALLALAPAPLARLARAAAALDTKLASALETSPFVYVSPLKKDGAESTCHGEVWYAWIDGAVVLTTARTTWKARSLERGLSRARIWVGDYGRVKQLVGQNDAFRAGPSFTAKAELSKDPALLERVLGVYEKKYPAEIGRWRERMREGQRDGSRVLIRYVPDLAAAGAART